MISASGQGASHNSARSTSAGLLSELPKGGKNLGRILSPACLPTTNALVTCQVRGIAVVDGDQKKNA